ncbi:sulfur carrier protein ThiS [Cognatilysobacter terrigena]|uniref:sulfur carrier protein ThiS n=1 Tax=Cognatilysobacter terrigena TaxID=2488749 RepID=UPI001061F4AA|nr:sulfur carrier protein ThiS [Lysobacter terrigena]
MESSLTLQLNGETRVVPVGTRLRDLLDLEGLGQRRVAVEINGEIVPRSRHADYALHGGDRVEIVHALGGG